MVMECLWIKAEGTVPRVFQSRSTQLQSRGFLSLSLMRFVNVTEMELICVM